MQLTENHTFITLRGAARLMLCCALLCSLSGCIDEDLTNCGKEYKLNYNVLLQTNLATEIATELSMVEDKNIAAVLQQELSKIFTDVAKDVDLSFYHNNTLAHHEQHEIDANSASFTFYLPVNDYQHLAFANLQASPDILCSGTQTDAEYKLSTNLGQDTIDSQTIGVFSARQAITVQEKNQEFNIELTMCNSSAVAVIDVNGYSPKNIRGFTTGFATGFMANDSTFLFERNQSVRAKQITDNGDYLALYTVNFPSRETSPNPSQGGESEVAPQGRTTSYSRMELPSLGGAGEGLWQFYIYVQMPDNKWTENILSVQSPLQAGQLKVIKLLLDGDGVLRSKMPDVGVSVTLDWHSAGEYEIEM